ncbi:CPBP family intramembrane glutamic endopeptidase [Halovenus halobia]|uniref:CPBP family intramembrane glutamic endopeptidase n=1 Tax=Halovenus halobia TaxID=3396622 RepID=UPI003F566D02
MSSLWRDLRVGLRIGRASVRDRFRRNTSTRREKAAFALLALFVLPGIILFTQQAYSAGVASRGGVDGPVIAVVRNALLPAMGVFTVVAGLEAVQRLGSDSVRTLLLTSASTRAIVVGKVLSLLVSWLVLLALGFTLLVAYAVGARAVLFPVAVAVAIVPVFVLVLCTGLAVGYLLWLGVDKLGLSEGSRQLVTAGLYMIVILGMFAGGSLVGGATAEGGLTGLIPTGPPTTPVGWYADLFFIGSPMTPTLGLQTVLAAGLVLGAIPLAFGLVIRLAPLYWYSTPSERSDDESEQTTAPTKSPSELIGWTPGTLTGRSPTVRVLLALVRNAVRQPSQYVYLFYYIFPIAPILVQQALSAPGAIPLTGGAALLVLGVWLAGGLFCLNPLGSEGAMLSQLVLAERRAETFVHARLLAGSALGVVLTTAGLLALTVSADFVTLRFAAAGVGFAGAATVTSAGMALGLGSVLPKFEAVEIFESVETVAPSIIAALVHAVLSLLLLLAGLGVAAAVALPESPLSVGQQVGAVGLYAGTLLLIGDGSRRYAIARFRDYGREVARTDRPFAVYAALGLSILAFLLGQAVSTAVVLVLNLDPQSLVLFPTLFVVQYAGFALVAVGFLYATHRGLAYIDLSKPSVRQTAFAGGGLVATFAVWGVVSLVVAGLGLPATDHALFDPSEDGNPQLLLVLIPLVLFVNGPVEELLYRNVIQKYLTERFSVPVAIAAASAIFSLAHVPAYISSGLTALSVTLTLLFAIACLWGWVYHRTESLLVVSAIHGLYNAVLIGALYVQVA